MATLRQIRPVRIAIHKWLQEPGFQIPFRLAGREVFVAVVSRLQQVSGEAIETLREG